MVIVSSSINNRLSYAGILFLLAVAATYFFAYEKHTALFSFTIACLRLLK